MSDYGQDYFEGTGMLDPVRGPFFCGINFVMNMSQFNIMLIGPCSTSKELAVAARFGGAKEFLIEFVEHKLKVFFIYNSACDRFWEW